MNTNNTVLSPPKYQILLYYKYITISDPKKYSKNHLKLCEELSLKGRIIISSEGINGTLSGTFENTNKYIKFMNEDPLTYDMKFKIDPSKNHEFPKLSIKVRDEIVTFNSEEKTGIDPNEITGKHLSPIDFYNKMQDDSTVIIDGRNDYESDLGHFKNAICPPIRNFREFPKWFKKNKERFKDKSILTYCTGGIRCEKLSGFIKKEGFKDVYQLDGGIINYGKDNETKGRFFDGFCYVFDQRVKVNVNQTETKKIISSCRYCSLEESVYGNCKWPDCNEQIFVCSDCREVKGLYCDDNCRYNHLN